MRHVVYLPDCFSLTVLTTDPDSLYVLGEITVTARTLLYWGDGKHQVLRGTVALSHHYRCARPHVIRITPVESITGLIFNPDLDTDRFDVRVRTDELAKLQLLNKLWLECLTLSAPPSSFEGIPTSHPYQRLPSTHAVTTLASRAH